MENFQRDFTKDADEGEKGSWRALIFTKYQVWLFPVVWWNWAKVLPKAHILLVIG